MGGNEAVIENAELLQKGMLEYVQYLEEALNTTPVGMLLSTVKVVVYDLSNSILLGRRKALDNVKQSLFVLQILAYDFYEPLHQKLDKWRKFLLVNAKFIKFYQFYQFTSREGSKL